MAMTSSLARSHQARPDFAPVKLSTFHAQALLACKLIYKHNFSPSVTLFGTIVVFCISTKVFF